jgi:hypothetical protein|tara:strand:- start:945 stop:1124 length:180 start_codon:yes stop_codon:yes gene_type:complete
MTTEQTGISITDQDIQLLLKRLPIAASELRAIVAERQLAELQAELNRNGRPELEPDAQG